MKASTGVLEKMSKEELDRMTKEIKETLALECHNQVKVFSSADLWNIQRRRKSTSYRRNYV